MINKEDQLKQEIKEYAAAHGADIIGFAGVDRWPEFNEIPADFWPTALWDKTRTVIVVGMQMPLPIVDTTPSNIHLETYETSNRELDGLAYNLTRYLNKKGHASICLPRDGYRSLKKILEIPNAPFSHTFAAKYAGLGTVSRSHNLLTPEFGSRVRLVSVFTDAVIKPDSVLPKDLCIHCGVCAKCCPSGALKEVSTASDYYYDLDVKACVEMHQILTKKRAYPCGICTKVCPVGKDRELYQEKGMGKKYLAEQEALEKDINDPEYKTWNHFRRLGSWAIEDDKLFEPKKDGKE
ncbi:MAG: epoxyqueuosine reductase [Desulfotomaculaceae bacterium]|nr:epoxyqueuosine reductase [Desulfotomaculaceae bacterium]